MGSELIGEPSVPPCHAHSAKSLLYWAAPYCDSSTRLLVISNEGSSAYSTSAMSGAPVPAFSASAIFVYSGTPAPTLLTVAQIPGCVALNSSAARLKPGTQAQIVSWTPPDLQCEPETAAPGREDAEGGGRGQRRRAAESDRRGVWFLAGSHRLSPGVFGLGGGSLPPPGER